MQHLERHLALEVQVPHPIHPAEPARAQQREQLVVVAQGPAEPLLPLPAILGAGGRPGHDAGGSGLERPGVRREVLQHLGRGEIAVLGGGLEGAKHDPLDGAGRGRDAARSGGAAASGSSGGSLAGDRVVEERARGVDVGGRIAGAPPRISGAMNIGSSGSAPGGTAGSM